MDHGGGCPHIYIYIFTHISTGLDNFIGISRVTGICRVIYGYRGISPARGHVRMQRKAKGCLVTWSSVWTPGGVLQFGVL